MKHDKTDPEPRRDFLMTSAAVAAGVAATALLPGVAPAKEEGAAVAQPAQKGYQSSQHVRDYYRAARI